MSERFTRSRYCMTWEEYRNERIISRALWKLWRGQRARNRRKGYIVLWMPSEKVQ